jgi:hypothetical protein
VYIKLAAALLGAVLSRASAADPTLDEYRVKGAFLLNFSKFVEWPPEAFHGPQDPISICVLGANPFTPALDAAAHAVIAENRQVIVRQIGDPLQARQCQIVFLSVSERKRVRAVLEAVQGGNVLTVGETAGFVASGGVIELRVEEGKIRIEINTAGAKRAGLHISAKLLSLAQSDNK